MSEEKTITEMRTYTKLSTNNEAATRTQTQISQMKTQWVSVR
jgi:hypothetical protein